MKMRYIFFLNGNRLNSVNIFPCWISKSYYNIMKLQRTFDFYSSYPANIYFNNIKQKSTAAMAKWRSTSLCQQNISRLMKCLFSVFFYNLINQFELMKKLLETLLIILFLTQITLQASHITDTTLVDFEPNPFEVAQQRIVEFFQYDGQDALLTRKLQMMGHYVDYFVIFEAAYEFNGKLKGLSFNKLNFPKHQSKIIYLPIRSFPHFGGNLTQKEAKQNQNFFFGSFSTFFNFIMAQNTIVIMSEIESIIKKQAILNFKNSKEDQACFTTVFRAKSSESRPITTKLLSFRSKNGINKRFFKAFFSKSCPHLPSYEANQLNNGQQAIYSPVKLTTSQRTRYLTSPKKRLAIQCSPFNGQQAIFSLKLEIQKQFIDYYILTQSPYSHTGVYKGLDFNISDYGEYTHKIIYLPLLTLPHIYNGTDLTRNQRWANQLYMRNQAALFLKYFAHPEDIILASDIDQIISKQGFQQFDPQNDVLVQTQMRTYFFYFNRRSVFDSYKKGVLNYMYACTQILTYKHFQRLFHLNLDMLRANACKNYDKSAKYKLFCPQKVIRLAGWHFSYVLNDAGLIKKLRSYADAKTSKIKTPNFTEARLSGVLDGCYTKDFDLLKANLPDEIVNDVVKYKQKSKYAEFLTGIDYGSLNYDQKELQNQKIKQSYAEMKLWMQEQLKLWGRRELFIAQVFHVIWLVFPYLGIIGSILIVLALVFCNLKRLKKDEKCYQTIESEVICQKQ